jgi:hypothetical protein
MHFGCLHHVLYIEYYMHTRKCEKKVEHVISACHICLTSESFVRYDEICCESMRKEIVDPVVWARVETQCIPESTHHAPTQLNFAVIPSYNNFTCYNMTMYFNINFPVI